MALAHAPLTRRKLTWDEYAAIQAQTEERLELIDGEIFHPMAGARKNHYLISSNLMEGCIIAARGVARFFSGDTQVAIGENEIAYPDGTLTVQAEFTRRGTDILLNPVVVFEILSESTGPHDFLRKLPKYFRMPSVREVVLIDSTQYHVMHYRRAEGGEWQLRLLVDLADAVRLESVAAVLPLADLYRDVTLPETESGTEVQTDPSLEAQS
ncbi:MAG: Uma2 family endonuclease [Fimbriimonadaceae bacterium]|nr:Uma2 family endonuclease [Fimbriimonadaceae bacterium]